MGDAGALMLGLLMAMLRHRDHRHARPGDRGRQRRVRPLAAAGSVHPDPAADRGGAAAAARLRARGAAAHARRQVAVLARSQAPAPPHARHGPLRSRRRADLLRMDRRDQPRRPADVHRHARRSGPATTSSGVGFGVIGVAACLVVTFLPSRRSAPTTEPVLEPTPDDLAPIPSRARPILRTTLLWSAARHRRPRRRRRRRSATSSAARRDCGARWSACSWRRCSSASPAAAS